VDAALLLATSGCVPRGPCPAAATVTVPAFGSLISSSPLAFSPLASSQQRRNNERTYEAGLLITPAFVLVLASAGLGRCQ
jgi:hypothetical protein